MGKKVVFGLLAGAVALGGVLFWFYAHREHYNSLALVGVEQEIRLQLPRVLAPFSQTYELDKPDLWELQFVGSELWIKTSKLMKKQGIIQTSDFNAARLELEKSLHDLLSNRPGDDKRFPIRVRFENDIEVVN